ncbi:hypothetical protein [Microbacterium sp. 77mftsu3.1]|uniref:hypothetical protein n=1 Tax=Microbacterium sp. 77mftsu3.1 TaxID=1761802 RepID=UPI00035D9633|nr:hypothetical protein [Microbacterium sp. 77mftsu3.1]SDH50094.1 hypothetical protein SAMN04488590_3458 [Microbacterium sp. 77mftsu3.1]
MNPRDLSTRKLQRAYTRTLHRVWRWQKKANRLPKSKVSGPAGYDTPQAHLGHVVPLARQMRAELERREWFA